FYFDSHAQNPNDAAVHVIPIFIDYLHHLNLLYKRCYITTFLRFPYVPRLTGSHVESLDLFDSPCEDPSLHLAFSMQRGDMLVGNNYSILHSRTKYVDFDEPQHRRLMYRL